MGDTNTKSVRYPPSVDAKFVKLALKLGRTKRQLFVQMVDYFYKSKKDPADLNDEVLKRELSSGVNRILSFIRKQEDDLLVPIYRVMGELEVIAKAQTPVLRDIGAGQREAGTMASGTIGHLKLVESSLQKILKGVEDKKTLKAKFSRVLDYYISQRESLGWAASNAKKEELVRHVRQALENL